MGLHPAPRFRAHRGGAGAGRVRRGAQLPDGVAACPDAAGNARGPAVAPARPDGVRVVARGDGAPMTTSRSCPPDPAEARTATDFVRSLARLRQWAGEPPLRRLRSLGGQAVTPDGTTGDVLPKSTTSHVLRQTGKLPRWDFVKAFVTACLRYCDYPAELVPAELERWRAARSALAGPAVRTDTGEATPPTAGAADTPAEAVAGSTAAQAGPGGRPERDPAAELLARRVAREEDRARK